MYVCIYNGYIRLRIKKVQTKASWAWLSSRGVCQLHFQCVCGYESMQVNMDAPVCEVIHILVDGTFGSSIQVLSVYQGERRGGCVTLNRSQHEREQVGTWAAPLVALGVEQAGQCGLGANRVGFTMRGLRLQSWLFYSRQWLNLTTL